MSIITIFLLSGILIIPLLAAFVFKSKADKLKEQKPIQFIIYNLLMLSSPVIIMEVFFFFLPEIWAPSEYSYLFLIVCLAAILVIRILITKEEWFYMKQMRKENKELAKVYSIFSSCLIITLIYPIFFMKGVDIKTYIAGFLILVFWIYTIYTILIVLGKIKNVICSH